MSRKRVEKLNPEELGRLLHYARETEVNTWEEVRTADSVRNTKKFFCNQAVVNAGRKAASTQFANASAEVKRDALELSIRAGDLGRTWGLLDNGAEYPERDLSQIKYEEPICASRQVQACIALAARELKYII